MRTRWISQLLLLTAALLAAGGLGLPADRAHGQIDLTGQWEISFAGDFSGSCEAAIFQTATNLQAFASCDVAGGGELTGTIDEATGAVAISGDFGGIPVGLIGTAAADGNVIDGTWSALGIFSGTFVATRTGPTPELIDLSGTWDIVLYGTMTDRCEATFAQTLADLSADLACEGLGSFSLSGRVDVLSGYFELGGEAGPSSIFLGGFFDGASGLLSGFWSDFAREEFGGFVGAPAGGLDGGIVALDCGGGELFFGGECFVAVDDVAPVHVHVITPPAGGATGLHAKLDWEEGVLVETGPPQLLEACEPAAPTPELPPSVLDCPFPDPADPPVGPVMAWELRCGTTGAALIDLVSREQDPAQGTHFVDSKGGAIDPLLFDATVYCYVPGEGGDGDGFVAPPQPGGDGPPGDEGATPTEQQGGAQPTDTPAAATPPATPSAPEATPTESAEVLALPSAGAPRSGGGTSVVAFVLLGAGGALALAAAWRLRSFKGS